MVASLPWFSGHPSRPCIHSRSFVWPSPGHVADPWACSRGSGRGDMWAHQPQSWAYVPKLSGSAGTKLGLDCWVQKTSPQLVIRRPGLQSCYNSTHRVGWESTFHPFLGPRGRLLELSSLLLWSLKCSGSTRDLCLTLSCKHQIALTKRPDMWPCVPVALLLSPPPKSHSLRVSPGSQEGATLGWTSQGLNVKNENTWKKHRKTYFIIQQKEGILKHDPIPQHP